MESVFQRYYILHGCVCAKELLAKSERAVSAPQCHMDADSDNLQLIEPCLLCGVLPKCYE
jgi:hypothetical protein